MNAEEQLDAEILVSLTPRNVLRLVAAAEIIQARAGSPELAAAIDKLKQATGMDPSQNPNEGS